MAVAETGILINSVPIHAGQGLPEGVVFFRDFDVISSGEESPNELIVLKEPKGEVTAMVSNPTGNKSRTSTFRPDSEIIFSRVFSSEAKAEALYTIPNDVEIRIRIKSEHPGKLSIGQVPTHPQFKMEHFYAEDFEVDGEWREVVVRSRDIYPYAKEGASRDFTSGIEIGAFVIYGFGTGTIYLDSFAVVSTLN